MMKSLCQRPKFKSSSCHVQSTFMYPPSTEAFIPCNTHGGHHVGSTGGAWGSSSRCRKPCAEQQQQGGGRVLVGVGCMPWTKARLDSKCVHNCDEKFCGCVGWRLGSRSNLRLLRCTNHYAFHLSAGRESALCPLSLYRRRESERQRGCPQVSDVRLRIYTLSANVGDGCWAPLSMVREVCAGCSRGVMRDASLASRTRVHSSNH